MDENVDACGVVRWWWCVQFVCGCLDGDVLYVGWGTMVYVDCTLKGYEIDERM